MIASRQVYVPTQGPLQWTQLPTETFIFLTWGLQTPVSFWLILFLILLESLNKHLFLSDFSHGDAVPPETDSVLLTGCHKTTVVKWQVVTGSRKRTQRLRQKTTKEGVV